MANIDRIHRINSNDLSGELYFNALIQEAYNKGLLVDHQVEDIQLQCIGLLAHKNESYNDGKSSSIRVEAAESIMKSNLYTIGLYLKSLKDVDMAIGELKATRIYEMYEKGRKIINIKFNTAKHIYQLVQRSKLNTINYTYNATLGSDGIGSFFKEYMPEFEANEIPSSIDYQLCDPVNDLAGVEYIQKYLEHLLFENEFCQYFHWKDIHHLLCGYDTGYKELLINIFEHVLTAAIGCMLAERNFMKLDISEIAVRRLNNELANQDKNSIVLKVKVAAGKVIEELKIINPYLISYIEKGLPKISENIFYAVKINTLNKTLVVPVNPDLKPKIQFLSGTKMEDGEYRKLLEELGTCRYSSDKLVLIREKIRSFGDMEDLLLDTKLSFEEIWQVLGSLEDIELAALLQRHPPKSDIQAVDLSGEEKMLRLYLGNYIDKLSKDRRKGVFEILGQLSP